MASVPIVPRHLIDHARDLAERQDSLGRPSITYLLSSISASRNTLLHSIVSGTGVAVRKSGAFLLCLSAIVISFPACSRFISAPSHANGHFTNGPWTVRELWRFDHSPNSLETSCESAKACLAMEGGSIFRLDFAHNSATRLSMPISDPDWLTCFRIGGCAIGKSACTGSGSRCSTEIFRQVGGDRTWKKIFSQGYSRESYSMISCGDARHCILAGKLNDGPGVMRITNNGGSSWTMLPPSKLYNVWDFAGITCLTVKHCVAAGAQYPGHETIAMISDNGGKTWKQTDRTYMPTAGYPEDLECNGDTCAIADSIPLLSQDAGDTWSLLPAPFASANEPSVMTEISCTNASSCIAMGIGPQIVGRWFASIVLGGPSWDLQNTTDRPIACEQFVSPTECIGELSAGGDSFVVTVTESGE